MNYQLLHGNSYEMVSSWPSNAALLTDPPYGMGYKSTHSTAPNRQHLQRIDGDFAPIVGDEQPINPAPFLRFKWVCLWGGQFFADVLPASRQWFVWDKRAGKTPSDQSDAELAWTNQDGPLRLYTHLWRGMMRAGEENIVHSPKLHPNQKPVSLWLWVLQQLRIPQGTLVLDPFAGSASLGIACMRYGCDYLGVEIDAHYWQVGTDRLAREAQQPVLLTS